MRTAALLTKNVRLIDAAARDLAQISLDDALRNLVVLAESATSASNARPRGSPRG